MNQRQLFSYALVASVAAGLTLGVTKKVLDVSEAVVIMMCVLFFIFIAMSEAMAAPPRRALALGPPSLRLETWQGTVIASPSVVAL
jgi:hydrogenase/urease accessory protein HupE